MASPFPVSQQVQRQHLDTFWPEWNRILVSIFGNIHINLTISCQNGCCEKKPVLDTVHTCTHIQKRGKIKAEKWHLPQNLIKERKKKCKSKRNKPTRTKCSGTAAYMQVLIFPKCGTTLYDTGTKAKTCSVPKTPMSEMI